jgi:hypothetical protein
LLRDYAVFGGGKKKVNEIELEFDETFVKFNVALEVEDCMETWKKISREIVNYENVSSLIGF